MLVLMYDLANEHALKQDDERQHVLCEQRKYKIEQRVDVDILDVIVVLYHERLDVIRYPEEGDEPEQNVVWVVSLED